MSKQMKRQAGFTLVELAVVMIIIGLLIGGVLKGQELISNAQVTSTVSQVKGVDAAVSTFRDMYSALPGDMLNSTGRLPGCTAAPCNTPGDGNGRLGTGGTVQAPSAAPAGEALTFFVHLSAADLVTGINDAGGTTWGGVLPEAKIGGGFQPASSTGAVADFADNAVGARAGLYLSLTATPNAAPSATTGVVTPNHAFRIDSKIDDGIADSGSVRAFGTGCEAAAGGAYAEDTPAESCGLHIRIQG